MHPERPSHGPCQTATYRPLWEPGAPGVWQQGVGIPGHFSPVSDAFQSKPLQRQNPGHPQSCREELVHQRTFPQHHV